MNAQEIIDVIQSKNISVSEFAYCDFDSPLKGVGEWEEVEQVDGEEEGSNWYSVKYFKDHDVYIKTTGYYTSYYGTDFYDGYGFEVRPTQKTITVYEAV